MADKDSNIIKPVESLQNITGLTPARRREERKRRQDLHKKQEQEIEEEPNETIDEQNLSDELTENENGQNTIDYCA
ncbi:MAG: hypothetical protein ACYS0C_00550 [Planctomycetota bacterium]|jgi:hypothetical protein